MNQIEPPVLECSVCSKEFKAPKLQYETEYCFECWEVIIGSEKHDVICKYE